jgi:uncharacterized protein (TIGR03083 family)
MNEDAAWAAIDTQRLRIAALLDDLDPEAWAHRSLCSGWTVRDVAAHLTLQQTGLREVLAEVVRHPAPKSLNRSIHDWACRKAAVPTSQLISEIRGMAGSCRHDVGLTYKETLIDILVHGQDIARPLGRRVDSDPEAAAVAGSRVWSKAFMFNAQRRLRGLRLSATDTDWSVGAGDDVTGRMIDLLLLLTGRPAALPRLGGAGAQRLASRMSADQSSG